MFALQLDHPLLDLVPASAVAQEEQAADHDENDGDRREQRLLPEPSASIPSLVVGEPDCAKGDSDAANRQYVGQINVLADRCENSDSLDGFLKNP